MRELAWEHRELVGEHFKDISNFFREHAPPNAPDAPGSMLPRGGEHAPSMLPLASGRQSQKRIPLRKLGFFICS